VVFQFFLQLRTQNENERLHLRFVGSVDGEIADSNEN